MLSIKTDDFNHQKIIWGEISDNPKFSIDLDGDYYVEATTFMMTGNDLWYLLAVLNSPLSKLGTTTGVGTLRWKKYKLEEFAIPYVVDVKEEYITNLKEFVKQPLLYDSEIRSIVFQIYGLSEVEISHILDLET